MNPRMKLSHRRIENVKVNEHPSSKPGDPKWLAIVINRKGYAYSATFAGDEPSEIEVRQAWWGDPNHFEPYYV